MTTTDTGERESGTTRRDARRARLGPEAVAAAQAVAADAPAWTDEKRRAVEALLRQYGIRADEQAAS